MYTGSVGTVVISVMPKDVDKRDSAAWRSGVEPDWFTIEFSYRETDSDSFVVSQELRELLNPTFYKSPQPVSFRPAKFMYWYDIAVPESISGKRICARLTVTTPPYGPILMKNGYPTGQKSIACFSVFEATTKRQVDISLTSHVQALDRHCDDERTAEFVDSLVATGWRDERGIQIGIEAARRLVDPRTELRLLEALFEFCGCVFPRAVDDMHYEPIGGGSAEDTAAYIWKRERLLKLIDEQKSQ